MAWEHSVNIDLADVAYAGDVGSQWYLLKEFLKANGWVVKGSGDGQSLYLMDGAAGANGVAVGGHWDVLSGIGTMDASLTAGMWSNQRAWFVLQSPEGQYELLFQRSTNTGTLSTYMGIIALSHSGYSATGIAANSPPAATADEQAINNVARNGAGTSGFHTATTDTRLHMVCDVAPALGEEASPPPDRAFAMWTTNKSTQAMRNTSFFVDVVDAGVDDDVAAFVCAGAGANASESAYKNLVTPNKLSYGGLTGGTKLSDIQSQTRFTGGTQLDGAERAIAVIWFGNTSGVFKGRSRLFRQNNGGSRNYPDTVNLAESTARVYVDHVLMPWEPETVPL